MIHLIHHYRAWHRDNQGNLTGVPMSAPSPEIALRAAQTCETEYGRVVYIESRDTAPFDFYDDLSGRHPDRPPSACQMCIYAPTCWQYEARKSSGRPCDIFSLYD